MNWSEDRKKFVEKKDKLDAQQTKLNETIQQLNKQVADFIQRGGLSQDPATNPQYQSILASLTTIENTKSQYNAINQEILKYLKDNSTTTKWDEQLNQNGVMQQEIIQLERIQKEMKVDVDSALARDELLRTKDTRVSRHDLFLFNRPVSRSLVPFLWALSIVFIAVGLFIFKITFPVSMDIPMTGTFTTLLSDYFYNNMIWISFTICLLIVIIFLSLTVAGVFKS